MTTKSPRSGIEHQNRKRTTIDTIAHNRNNTFSHFPESIFFNYR